MPIEFVFSQWKKGITKEYIDNEDDLVFQICKANRVMTKKLC